MELGIAGIEATKIRFTVTQTVLRMPSSALDRFIACLKKWFVIAIPIARTELMRTIAKESCKLMMMTSKHKAFHLCIIQLPFNFRKSFGEVMERSFGIWHTKCFPKHSPPFKQEVINLCKELGYHNTTEPESRIAEARNATKVEFESANATKVILYTKFFPVKINKEFSVHLKPSKPVAKMISWEKTDNDKCSRLEIKCVTKEFLDE